MPQLDILIIFPQIFWFFLLFIGFYIILLHYILPYFLIILKSRKVIIVSNSKEILKITENSFKQKKVIIKYIQNSLNIINNNFKSSLKQQKQVGSYSKIDFNLTFIIKELVLYYNVYSFNLIKLYHKNFSFKK